MERGAVYMKQFIREITPYAKLYRDNRNGIAWIEDGSTGLGHSCHPNISQSGSVIGMKQLGYWGREDRTVRSHGWVYNIDRFAIDTKDKLDLIVANECMCQACIERRRESR